MKTKKIKKWLLWGVRYLLPILLGWLEGDTHTIADGVTALLGSF